MTEIEGNLRGVLNCVETLVKNIRRRRDQILKGVEDKACVSTNQLSQLLSIFVDQILDDNNKTSEEQLSQILSEEPHKNLSVVIDNQNNLSKDLRQQIKSLEDSLKKEAEDKQRIQKSCSKIIEKCRTIEGNHKTQIEELNQTIEDLKKSESELKSRITDLINTSPTKPKFDPLFDSYKCEVKQELIEETLFKGEESHMNTAINGFHTNMETDIELESGSPEDQTLKNKCLASKLAINLGQRVDSSIESSNESVAVDGDSDNATDIESVIDLTTNNANKPYHKNRGPVLIANRSVAFVKRGRGRKTRFHCNSKNCGYTCRSRIQMVQHIHKSHSHRNMQFVCNICSKKFTMLRGLRLHARVHQVRDGHPSTPLHITRSATQSSVAEVPTPTARFNTRSTAKLSTDPTDSKPTSRSAKRNLRAVRRLSYALI